MVLAFNPWATAVVRLRGRAIQMVADRIRVVA